MISSRVLSSLQKSEAKIPHKTEDLRVYLICACEKLVWVSLVTSASLKGWFHGPVSHILDTHYSPQSAE